MKILIVGLGSIALKHLKAINQIGLDCKVYALRSSFKSEEIEGVINIYNSNQLLDLKFDFAIISTPTHLHYENILDLAFNNIPLFIEKPAIHSLKNADKLVDLLEAQNLITYVACNLRFHPCILYLKDKIGIQNLLINEVNVYCGSYLPDWRPSKDFRSSYSSSFEMGGGAHLDLFHELDYSIWLFGKPETSNSFLRNKSTLKIDAIDYANYILEYETFAVNVILNLFRRKAKRTIELVLENETLCIDLINNSIKNDNGETIFSVKEYDISQTYTVQLKYFMDCLNSGARPMNSLRESVEILKIVLGNA
jgi:predicted dehydrogenase